MSGRHRRGWLSGLVTAVKRYYGFPTAPSRIAATLEVVQGEAVVALPVVYRDGPAAPGQKVTRILVGDKRPDSNRPRVRQQLPPGPVRRARYLAESPLYIAVSAALGMDQLLGVAA